MYRGVLRGRWKTCQWLRIFEALQGDFLVEAWPESLREIRAREAGSGLKDGGTVQGSSHFTRNGMRGCPSNFRKDLLVADRSCKMVWWIPIQRTAFGRGAPRRDEAWYKNCGSIKTHSAAFVHHPCNGADLFAASLALSRSINSWATTTQAMKCAK